MLTAIVTGAGQDASFLSELLLDNGYKVYLISRRKSVNDGTKNIQHLTSNKNFKFVAGDICDSTLIGRMLYQLKPAEMYNTAAQSHVGSSFYNPVETFRTNAEAVVIQLEAIRIYSPSTRYLNCATSEMFGGVDCPKEGYNESHGFNPRSPYAISKVAAFQTTKHYREAYGIHTSSSISFNHSSIRRGHDFATRKITSGCAAVRFGLKNTIKMGDLSGFRDESHAKDIVRGMYLMLQQDDPDDYVLASGSGATIEQMFRYVCDIAGLKFEEVYEMDEQFMRPSDVKYLLGNASKANKVLDWSPSYNWMQLLEEMYKYDIELLKRR